MSLNDSKPTYGTAPAVEENSGTKGSRRGLVVGLVGAGGEDVGFGVPHSHKTTPGGGVAAQGY